MPLPGSIVRSFSHSSAESLERMSAATSLSEGKKSASCSRVARCTGMVMLSPYTVSWVGTATPMHRTPGVDSSSSVA